jgi:hypothetical protein
MDSISGIYLPAVVSLSHHKSNFISDLHLTVWTGAPAHVGG